MITYEKTLKRIKQLKNLTIHWDEDNRELVFERDKILFTIFPNEIFPLQRTLTRIFQSFRGWKKKKWQKKEVL